MRPERIVVRKLSEFKFSFDRCFPCANPINAVPHPYCRMEVELLFGRYVRVWTFIDTNKVILSSWFRVVKVNNDRVPVVTDTCLN